MKFYLLINNEWQPIELYKLDSISNYRRIKLYNDDLIPIGIGLYKKG